MLLSRKQQKKVKEILGIIELVWISLAEGPCSFMDCDMLWRWGLDPRCDYQDDTANRSLFDGCKAELERQGDRFFTNPFSLWDVLGKSIKGCRTDPVYILINGVDGLKESLCKLLIRRILKFREIRTVKIFLSSRDAPHISNSLPCNHHAFTKINLDTNSTIKEDVEIFIRYRVNARS